MWDLATIRRINNNPKPYSATYVMQLEEKAMEVIQGKPWADLAVGSPNWPPWIEVTPEGYLRYKDD